MRLFAALDLDDATRERLAKVGQDLRRIPGIKWSKPEALHVTVRFFGEVPKNRLDELTQALGRVEGTGEPVEIRLTRLGFLPSEQKPRVVVAVGETPRALAEFQRRVEEAARALGFEPEKRAFLTHVTLGRMRDPRQGKKLVAAAREYEADLGGFVADRWTLYRSELTPRGAVYTTVTRWAFD